MNARSRAPSGYSSYEESKPRTRWVSEEGVDTFLIVIDVPEYKKENLTVRLTASRTLKISGQRLIRDNTWELFTEEVQVPEHCDASRATAKLQHGILQIRLPRIAPLTTEENPALKAQGSLPAAATTRPPLEPSPARLPQNNVSAEAEKKAEEKVYDAPPASQEKENKSKEKREEEEKPDKTEVHAGENKSLNPERKSFSEMVSRSGMLNSCFFNELKKPENLKKAIIIVVSGVVVGLFIAGMLKWYGDGDHDSKLADSVNIMIAEEVFMGPVVHPA